LGSFNDFLELEVLDHVFSAATYTAPATLYVALYTVTPSDTGGGTEVTGGSYARVAVTNNATNFPAAAAGAKANGTAITFPAPTANWGVVTHFAIYNAATVGNELFWGALTVSKTINSGDAAPSFAIGALSIQIDN